MPPPVTPRPPPEEEAQRQAALDGLSVLDTAPEPALDALVQAAAALCATPVSLISLVDRDRQWFKANWGLPGLRQTPRDVALCAHTILGDDALVIPATRDDPRSQHNPLVTGAPHIGFYAGVPLRAPGGERIGALCVIDQHARQLSTEQLQGLHHLAFVASEWLRQRTLYERTPAMLHSIDAEGRLLSVSDQWLNRLGYRREDVLGRHSTAFLSPESARRAQQVLPALFASDRCERVPYEMRTHDGEAVQVELSAILERDAAGRAVRSMAILEDVTRRQEAESALADEQQALRRTQDLLARASAVAGLGAWEIDIHTRAMTWSAHLPQLLALPAGTTPSWASWISLFADTHRQQLNSARQAAETHGQGFDLELPCTRADGCPVWLRVVGSVEPPSGPARRLIGTVQDITARKQTEQQLEASRLRAEAASRAKGDFLANMSHEIRNPLNAVQGYVYLLAQTPLSAEQETLLGKLRQASQATLECINDVLDLAKIEAAELALVQEPAQLITLLQSAYSICEAQARQNGVRLRVEMPAQMPLVWADTKRLRQVVLNLLSNAVKFTAQGEVSLTLTWHPEPDAHHPTQTSHLHIAIDVTDTGIGMSPDTQSRIFEPFYQADDADSRHPGGTGLGLAIVRRLVTLMQGQIEIQSRVAEGTRFRVRLRLPVAQGPQSVPRAAPLAQTRVLQGLHVLVADDSTMNREVAAGILMLHGARVTQASHGREALSLAGQAVDLVLMDLHMPQMDGIEAARALRERLGERCPPIVALTGAATVSDQRQALEAGMCGFITKPVDAARLPLEILRALRAAPPYDSAASAVADDSPRATSSLPPGWPRLTGVDTVGAAHRLCGDLGLWARMLQQLLDEGASGLALLRALAARGQPANAPEGDTASPARPKAASGAEQALKAIHRLRGVAGNAGAIDIHRCLGPVEEVLRHGQPEGWTSQLDTLQGLLALLESQARPWLRSQLSQAPTLLAETATTRTLAISPLNTPTSSLAELRSLLEHRNLRALHALQHLPSHLLAGLSAAEREQLHTSVQTLRFDDALRCLAHLAAPVTPQPESTLSP